MKHKFQLWIIINLYFWQQIKCTSGLYDFSMKSHLNLYNFTLDCECLILVGYSMYSNQQIPYKEVHITI